MSRPGKWQQQHWPKLHTEIYSAVWRQDPSSISWNPSAHAQSVWWLELELLVLFLWVLFSVKGCKFSQSTSIISGSSAKGEKMTLYYSQKTVAEREKEKCFYKFWCQMFSKVQIHVCVCDCVVVCVSVLVYVSTFGRSYVLCSQYFQY